MKEVDDASSGKIDDKFIIMILPAFIKERDEYHGEIDFLLLISFLSLGLHDIGYFPLIIKRGHGLYDPYGMKLQWRDDGEFFDNLICDIIYFFIDIGSYDFFLFDIGRISFH